MRHSYLFSRSLFTPRDGYLFFVSQTHHLSLQLASTQSLSLAISFFGKGAIVIIKHFVQSAYALDLSQIYPRDTVKLVPLMRGGSRGYERQRALRVGGKRVGQGACWWGDLSIGLCAELMMPLICSFKKSTR